jgi:hypothetical protein
MRAEHRRELETNVLADRMGRFVQGMKSNPQATSIAFWVILLLALVTFFAWYYTSGTSRNRSALWVVIDDASFLRGPQDAEQELAAVAKDGPGTIAGRTARFQRARLLLPEGLRRFATEQRKDAVKDIVEARRLYEQLVGECGNDALLRQEALMGEAKAEEALVGVPDEEKAGESYGKLDRAIALYNQTAAVDAESFLGKQAADHAKQLEQNRADVEKFYTELNKLAATAKQ